MDILDISISNAQFSINQYTSPNTLVLADIFNMLKVDKYYDYYRTVKRKNKDMEDDKQGVPMMNKVFYSRFAYCSNITYQFFLNEYKRIHCIRTNGTIKFKSTEKRYQYSFTEQELDGKLLRAYMSFLKELFVLYSLKENGFSVRYSLQDDNNKGFDITVVNAYGHQYGIRICSDTEAAQKFIHKKEQERHDYNSNPHTVIVLKAPMERRVIGDTYLFTEEQMNALYNHIRNNKYETILL